MPLRKIATIGHPILRQPARPVTLDELHTPAFQRLIDDLIETMRDANGAGLAAPQIHEPVSLCAIEVNKNPRYPYKPTIPLTILVNPEVLPTTEETFDNYEGCLSVPNLRGLVPRYTKVQVKALDRQGTPLDFEVRGLSAGTYQHEVDHLLGKVFLDRVRDTTSLTTWTDFERFHQQAFVERARALVERFGS
jgi:peptide deformylase